MPWIQLSPGSLTSSILYNLLELSHPEMLPTQHSTPLPPFVPTITETRILIPIESIRTQGWSESFKKIYLQSDSGNHDQIIKDGTQVENDLLPYHYIEVNNP